MTAVITNSIHTTIAKAVYSEILSQSAKYYYFVGRTLALETDRATPTLTDSYESKTRNDIIAIREVNVGDVAFVVPQFIWTSGTVYNKYSSEFDGEQTRFYAMIGSTFSVYLCLDNNSSVASNDPPTGSSPDTIVTSDGYKWKFLYTIPLSLREKFLSNGYMPVSNSLSNRFYSNGSIDSVTITNQGSGYTQETTTIVLNPGDGSEAVLTPVISGGKLVEVIITNPGLGYVNPVVTVESTRSAATGAQIYLNLSKGDLGTAQAVIETLAVPGTIESLNLVNAGTSYSTDTTLTITGDGTGATAVIVITAGFITGVSITNAGTGYTWATVTPTNVGTGTGGSITANVSPAFGYGRDAIRQLGARRLMFYSSINQEKLSGFNLSNDYRQFGLLRNPRDFFYSTDLYDPTATGVYTIVTTKVAAPAATYPIGTVLIDSYPVVGNTKSYVVESITFGTTTTIGFTVRATDAIPGEITAGQTLHKTGDSASFAVPTVTSNALVKGTFLSGCYTLTGTFNAAAFGADEILIKGTSTYVVVAITGTKLLVQPTNGGTIAVADILTKQSSTNNYTVTTVAKPAFDRRTGDVLYIDNRAAFNQTEDQSVSFRTVIKY